MPKLIKHPQPAVGSVFERLTVTGTRVFRIKGKKRQIKCRCVCGEERLFEIAHLGKAIKSCGCLTRRGKTIHGMHRERVYYAWASMLDRCRNKNNKYYYNYGGRGISVCERWQKFVNFYADMGDRPKGMTLDRINNQGNYEPENCRWATRSEQQRNTRLTKLSIEKINAARKLISEGMMIKTIAEQYGVNACTLSNALAGRTWK